MKYLLYCDLKTTHCNKSIFDKLLSENSSSHLQISDSIWAFEIYEHAFSWEFQGVPEYFVRTLLAEYLDENSICFIHEVNLSHADYNLPKAALDYLFDIDQ